MTDNLLNLAIDMNNFIQQNMVYLPDYEKRVACEYQKEINKLVEYNAKIKAVGER